MSSYFLYAVLVACFGFFATSGTNTHAFHFQRTIVGNVEQGLADVIHPPDLWRWLRGLLMQGMDIVEGGDPVTSTPKLDLHNAFIGAVRVRQIRVRGSKCKSVVGKKCYPAYSESSESTSPWGGVKWTADAGEGMHGHEAPISSGGYVLDFPTRGNMTASMEMLSLFQNRTWFDDGTRVVIVDMSMYNEQIERVLLLRVAVQFLASGSVPPPFSVTTAQVFWPYASAAEDVKLLAWRVVEVIVALLAGIYLLRELQEFHLTPGRWYQRRTYSRYLFHDWNLLDLVSALLVLIGVGLHTLILYRLHNVFEGEHGIGLYSQYYGMHDLMGLQRRLNYVFSLAVVVVFLKLGKLVRYIPHNVGPFLEAVVTAICDQQVVIFLSFFIFLTVGVAFGIHFVRGSDSFDGHLLTTVFASWHTALGHFDPTIALDDGGSFSGTGAFLYVFLMFFFSLLFVNMFIAVVSNVYRRHWLGQEGCATGCHGWDLRITRITAASLWDYRYKDALALLKRLKKDEEKGVFPWSEKKAKRVSLLTGPKRKAATNSSLLLVRWWRSFLESEKRSEWIRWRALRLAVGNVQAGPLTLLVELNLDKRSSIRATPLTSIEVLSNNVDEVGDIAISTKQELERQSKRVEDLEQSMSDINNKMDELLRLARRAHLQPLPPVQPRV